MGEEQSPPMMPLMTCFSAIRDPQIERNKLYPLSELVVIVILALIALVRGREDIERYERTKQAWLRKFLSLEHGIPHMRTVKKSAILSA